jgi:hypothetical protein
LKFLPDLDEELTSRPARGEMKPEAASGALKAGSHLEQLKP